jgi:hypothetical protein
MQNSNQIWRAYTCGYWSLSAVGFALTPNKLNFSFLLALVIVAIKVKFTSFRYRYQVICNCIPGVDLDPEENCMSVNVCSALEEKFRRRTIFWFSCWSFLGKSLLNFAVKRKKLETLPRNYSKSTETLFVYKLVAACWAWRLFVCLFQTSNFLFSYSSHFR